MLVGFVGSILGRVLLGPFGPAWKEFFFLPALLGAVICVLIITLLYFMINKFY
ncbi:MULTISPECIES: GlsB/YeaQ/YmgE family stress response membrane protein [Bacillus cereus group]|uniref:GlsB/YeaQ/YmgE family stress response membrane protein n=1 Tax=Bacillus cereus group TaxID=86661 RepID=UPI0020D2799E|nr:GlsB/YeaQ/YmgE family stress response membrane protein [Bacillus thuringiensis]MCQ6336237.1 GlsB/YeaQ/YmgE family stress response membrane protein [Bacillus cereus]